MDVIVNVLVNVKDVLDVLVYVLVVQEIVRLLVLDIVIADVPCSGLGVLAGKCDIKNNASAEGMNELVGIQKDIAETVSLLMKSDVSFHAVIVRKIIRRTVIVTF